MISAFLSIVHFLARGRVRGLTLVDSIFIIAILIAIIIVFLQVLLSSVEDLDHRLSSIFPRLERYKEAGDTGKPNSGSDVCVHEVERIQRGICICSSVVAIPLSRNSPGT